MKLARIVNLLAATVVGLALIAACAPPGAQTEGQGSGGGGEKAQQDVAQASGDVCEVSPPDLSMKDAVVGFSQSE